MTTIYTAYVYPDGMPINISDAATSFDDVLDLAVSTHWGDVEFRMFRLDFDVETGAFETASEVTDQAVAIVLDRLDTRGFAAPEWMRAA